MASIKQAGATLLEMILVLVIMSSFLGMSYRFYNLYTYEQNVSLIRQQVGLIFDAMRLFYQANCNVYNASNWFAQSTTPTLVVLKGGYNALSSYLSTPIPINRLLNVTDSIYYNGYYAQFTLNTGSFVLPTSTNAPYGGNGSTSIGTVLNWTAHVAIEPAQQSQVTALYNELGANCGSNYLSAVNGVESCLDAGGVYGPPSCTFACPSSTCTAAPPVQSGSTYSCPASECGGFCAPFCCTGADGQLNQTVIWPPVSLASATLVEWEQGANVGSGNMRVNQATLPRLQQYKKQYENNAWQGFQSGGAYGGKSDSTNYYYCGS